MLSGKAMLELSYLTCNSKGLSCAKPQSCLSNLDSSPFSNLLMHLECVGKQQCLTLMFFGILFSLGSERFCIFCTLFWRY